MVIHSIEKPPTCYGGRLCARRSRTHPEVGISHEPAFEKWISGENKKAPKTKTGSRRLNVKLLLFLYSIRVCKAFHSCPYSCYRARHNHLVSLWSARFAVET